MRRAVLIGIAAAVLSLFWFVGTSSVVSRSTTHRGPDTLEAIRSDASALVGRVANAPRPFGLTPTAQLAVAFALIVSGFVAALVMMPPAPVDLRLRSSRGPPSAR